MPSLVKHARARVRHAQRVTLTAVVAHHVLRGIRQFREQMLVRLFVNEGYLIVSDSNDGIVAYL